ncbi:retrovirus-related pol polyprotein from transposon TNT 1-94 [Tanacetum coccineum]
MGQMLYHFQGNQRDYFSNDTFRGRSLVSSAVYYEVTPRDTFPLRHIFGGVTVTIQPVHGRQSLFAVGTSGTRVNILGTGGNNSGQQRVVKCFNCQGEGHIARQCLKPQRKRDATWFRDKVLLVEAQGLIGGDIRCKHMAIISVSASVS